MEYSNVIRNYLFLASVSVILAYTLMWSINQWSQYFEFVPINFWQSLSLVLISSCVTGFIKISRPRE